MKKKLLLLSVCGGLCFSASAVVGGETGNLPDLANQQSLEVTMPSILSTPSGSHKYRLHKQHRADENEVIHLEFTLGKAGDLGSMLGDNLLEVESLTVKGDVGAADFATMWKASFEGKLSEIDLSEASLENNEVPDNAFCHIAEQVIDGEVHCIQLYKLTLPDNVERIGQGAFNWCINLTEINLPTTLRAIGELAFQNCISLNMESLVIPEGVTAIGQSCFYNCPLRCAVTLPAGVKTIGSYAFCQSGITSINLPEGLESIGESAFAVCKLKTVTIPGSCLNLTGTGHFWQNIELAEIILPEGLTAIPDRFVSTCVSLEKINIPSTVKKIGEGAFYCCEKLRTLELPEGLEEIGAHAFFYMTSLEEMIFPSSLKKLGAVSCMNWTSIKRVGCKAMTPPVCEPDAGNPEKSPFGFPPPVQDYNCEESVPLYIPIGTMAEYTQAYGWNYFTVNIHESEEMTPASVRMTVDDSTEVLSKKYDLTGHEIGTPARGQIYIQNGKKKIGR